jgi:predicted metal-dependent phosphoesterase TrpH
VAVDLHLHSTASDGTDPPARIVDLAVAAGLDAIAITDHDNLDGIAEARSAAPAALEVVSGTELSVDWNGRAVHLLVYFLEPGPGPLQDRLDWLQRSRHARNLRIVERCNRLGIDITFEEVMAEAEGRGVGRPHFAAVMLRKGHVDSIPEAFDRYLGSGGILYEPRDRLDAAEAIQLAIASGAVTSLAHPHTVAEGRDDYAATFRGLADLGLHGIEAHYGEYDPTMRHHLATQAAALGLVATGGSDYHGSYKPDLFVGVGRGDLVVPNEALEGLRARAAGTQRSVKRP